MTRTTDEIRVADLMTAAPVVIESDALATDAQRLPVQVMMLRLAACSHECDPNASA